MKKSSLIGLIATIVTVAISNVFADVESPGDVVTTKCGPPFTNICSIIKVGNDIIVSKGTLTID